MTIRDDSSAGPPGPGRVEVFDPAFNPQDPTASTFRWSPETAEPSPEAVRQAAEILHGILHGEGVGADWLAEVTGGGVPQVTETIRDLETEAGA